jgi:hypothetical protein
MAERAREEFEVKDRRQATAGGGDHLVIVLEFEFLSRAQSPACNQ